MRHALLAPGKRVRPLLTMLTAAQFGADPIAALDAGCAVELVHTASLVFDDLPCMDDSFTRRGQASTHVAFGEATAVLAGIALLTRSFAILSDMRDVPAATRVELTGILSRAAGAEGLAAGQERDLKDRSPADALEKINDINDQKTGALFIAAVQMGGRIANADARLLAALAVVGREIGLAFQALDDVIDMAASSCTAGKDTGKDVGKATVASLMGLEAARAQVALHAERATLVIAPFAPPDNALALFIKDMFDTSPQRFSAAI